ncbi:hypothetical protein XU18_1070 [Perkinsela sp. CCAP 1560/4]|nr:hypothetical protein XU18_1070 [Perkinsela sp. CCAP 1560/4]|eukprot:KNH08406.1 hypothetical protein XU18_1070 [Perkinsela sp. CCAP 1560/4]
MRCEYRYRQITQCETFGRDFRRISYSLNAFFLLFNNDMEFGNTIRAECSESCGCAVSVVDRKLVHWPLMCMFAKTLLVPTRRKDTSPWWVGPVPQFWGKPRTFLNPSSCFCHGADPIDGHRKVVGQDQYPALGEVRETAKLLPRGESAWWRDEGRRLLILCLFSIRGMRLAHKNNAKSREHAHTCRKARAIFKLRYKNKKQNKKRS